MRRGEDKLAVVKWRMGALCETSEVERGEKKKMEALKGHSGDLAQRSDKIQGLMRGRLKKEWPKSMQQRPRYPDLKFVEWIERRKRWIRYCP